MATIRFSKVVGGEWSSIKDELRSSKINEDGWNEKESHKYRILNGAQNICSGWLKNTREKAILWSKIRQKLIL